MKKRPTVLMNYDPDTKNITIHKNTGITISLGVLFVILVGVINITTSYNRLNSEVDQNTRDIAAAKSTIDQLQSANVTAQTQLAGINVQLKDINANILDIKTQLQK